MKPCPEWSGKFVCVLKDRSLISQPNQLLISSSQEQEQFQEPSTAKELCAKTIASATLAYLHILIDELRTMHKHMKVQAKAKEPK